MKLALGILIYCMYAVSIAILTTLHITLFDSFPPLSLLSPSFTYRAVKLRSVFVLEMERTRTCVVWSISDWKIISSPPLPLSASR